MFDSLISAWKQIHGTYIAGDIGKVMYYYLTSVLFVIGGIYMYIYYEGCIALAVIMSVFAGAQLSTAQPPITIVGAFGIVLIIRYTFLGALDVIAKKTPDKMLERLSQVEDKVRDLHQLAFTELMDEEQKQGIFAKVRADKKSIAEKAKKVHK
jgi:hypothetical protein